MKERGLIFSSPMVRALLAGTKTQTRRDVKPQPPSWAATTSGVVGRWATFDGDHPDAACEAECLHIPGPSMFTVKCPYGVAGDRSWVREAWRMNSYFDALPGSKVDAGTAVAYEAGPGQFRATGRYRHARFMPRWASRITLELTEVRVQRLQDITPADAEAEGIRYEDAKDVERSTVVCPLVDGYARLWDDINGEGSWAKNPFVWVLSFRRVTP